MNENVLAQSIPAALSGYDPDKVMRHLGKVSGRSGDPFFDLWTMLVDRKVSSRLGLGIDDLEDLPYSDWFEDGLTPSEAASLVFEEQGFGE